MLLIVLTCIAVSFWDLEIALGLFAIPASFFVLDKGSLFVFRLHRVVVSDESLVSVTLVLGLLGSLAIFIGTFAILALHDAGTVLDSSSTYVSTFLKDPNMTAVINDALLGGKTMVKHLSEQLAAQYEGTSWGPAVTFSTKILANITKGIEDNNLALVTTYLETLFSLKNEILSVGFSSAFANGSAKNALKSMFEGVAASLGLVLWLLFGFVDAGIRAAFFTGALLFLISTDESVLQIIMESILSVFSRAKTTIRKHKSNEMDGAAVPGPNPFQPDYLLRTLSSIEVERFVRDDRSFQAAPVAGVCGDHDAQDAEFLERKEAFKKFEDELRSTFSTVFAVPVSLAFFNAITTLLIFFTLNVAIGANLNASFFASAISLTLSLIPVVHPFLSCIPWVAVSSIVHGRHGVSFALLFTQYLAFTIVDSCVMNSLYGQTAKEDTSRQEKNSEIRSYVTGLAFFFGITSLGPHGVVLGPLFVSIFYTTSSTLLHMYRRDFSRSRAT